MQSSPFTAHGGAAPNLSAITQLPRDLLVTPSRVPTYHRLAQQLTALISTGQLRPEEQLPSEIRIAEHLHVSRPTVRHALSQLVAANRLRREQGRGTYVV